MLSDGEFGVALRQKTNVHRDQNVVPIDKTTLH